MPHVILSRSEAGYWSASGWCFDLASADHLQSATDAAQFLVVNPEAEVWPLERAEELGDFDPRHGDTVIALRNEAGSEVEAFLSELDRAGVEELAA